jgi:hypothetical protein
MHTRDCGRCGKQIGRASPGVGSWIRTWIRTWKENVRILFPFLGLPRAFRVIAAIHFSFCSRERRDKRLELNKLSCPSRLSPALLR